MIRQRRKRTELPHARVDQIAAPRQQGLADNRVIEIEAEGPVLEQMEQKRADVSRVHLAGMVRHRAGQVDGAVDRDAVLHHDLARLRELAIATPLGREIDDHRTGRHRRDHLARDEHGRLRSRHHRRRNHHVTLTHDTPEQFPLALIEGLVLRAGVSARILRVRGFEGQLDEPAAEALHLLFRGRAQS